MALNSGNIFFKYKNKWFVETGTNTGGGIDMALDADFENIISVELSTDLYNMCLKKYKSYNNILLFNGDSSEILFNMIKNIHDDITFWLDGHYSGPGTSIGKYETPLIQELNIIRNHPINTHTIIIDDLRCWKKEIHGFDKDFLIEFLMNINDKYQIIFEDGSIKNDILVACPKK